MKKLLDRVDARGFIGIAVFILVVAILIMIAALPELCSDEFFKTVATLLIGAFIKDVVGWAYTATKQGGELADRAQAVVEHVATAAPKAPQPVEVVNQPDQPVPTTTDVPAPDAGLPGTIR